MPTLKFSESEFALLRGAIEDSQFAIAVANGLETISGYPTLAEVEHPSLCDQMADAVRDIQRLDTLARRLDKAVEAHETSS